MVFRICNIEAIIELNLRAIFKWLRFSIHHEPENTLATDILNFKVICMVRLKRIPGIILLTAVLTENCPFCVYDRSVAYHAVARSPTNFDVVVKMVTSGAAWPRTNRLQ
jgi:hypothetical protein